MSELHLLVHYNDAVLLAYVKVMLHFTHVLYFCCVFQCNQKLFYP